MSQVPKNALKRALVVEANGIVALDTREMLLELGFAEVEALARVDTALCAIAARVPDWSLVDPMLPDGEMSPLIAALDAIGTAVVLVSSRPDGSDIAPRWADRRFVTRPYGREDLAALLHQGG